MAEEKTTAKRKMKGDPIIWAVFIILCMISVTEVFSASSNLTYKTSSYWGPVVKHVILLGFGVGFMLATMTIKCKYFKLIMPVALGFSIFLLVLCYFMGAINDGHRWIPIPIIGMQFQPSELAKGSVVLAVATILSAMQTDKGVDKRAIKYILFVSTPCLILIGLENLSTAALLGLVVFMMMWIGRVPKRQLGLLVSIVAILGIIGFATVMIFGNDSEKAEKQDPRMAMVDNAAQQNGQKQEKKKGGAFHRLDTWKSRIDKFLDGGDVPPEKFDLNNDAQEGYSQIAIASSNMVGKGPGNSTMRDYLPQAFSDFIYAIIVEEMGLTGAIAVCLLYIILLFRTATIASRCVNTFPALLVMGIAMMLTTQAVFNMGVAVGWLPVTGQPLPLISKGGTSSIMNCIYLGMILSVSCSAKKKEDVKPKEATPMAA